MKIHHIVFLFVALLPQTLLAEDKKTSDEADELSYNLGLLVGSQLKNSLENMKFDQFMKGFEKSYNEDVDPQTLSTANQKMQAHYQDRKQRQGKQALKTGEEFLKKNAKRKKVKTTDSGLQYEVLEKGKGDKPKASDTVTVHYRGTLINGTEFDSSHSRGTPATFALNRVIKGWTEGLQLMKKGAKYKFFVPSELAYGENGAGPKIGPNETLIFEVELIDIKSSS